jgi:hypothetical protein
MGNLLEANFKALSNNNKFLPETSYKIRPGLTLATQ